MNTSLVKRPRLAVATAVVIVVAVAIGAALFPNASSYRAALAPVPDVPGHGRGIDPAYGRKFVATEATEKGKPYEFPGEPPTLMFGLDGTLEIYGGCNTAGARPRLADGRLVSPPGWSMMACSPELENGDAWLTEFMDRRPRWRLDGDTLKLGSAFGTMTLTDKGEGRDPDDVLGHRFLTSVWERLDPDKRSRVLPTNWLSLSFGNDGTIRASLGCESIIARAEINAGWLDAVDEIVPHPRADCSPTMKAQKTEWFWEFLSEPLRWQSLDGWLVLKSASTSVSFGGYDKRDHQTDPDVISDLTFRSTWIDGGGAVRAGIEEGRGITITVSPDGELTAGVGCDRPTVRAEVRHGWLRFDGQAELSPGSCSKLEAERWLGDFMSDHPAWHLRKDSLFVATADTTMDFVEESEHLKDFAD